MFSPENLHFSHILVLVLVFPILTFFWLLYLLARALKSAYANIRIRVGDTPRVPFSFFICVSRRNI